MGLFFFILAVFVLIFLASLPFLFSSNKRKQKVSVKAANGMSVASIKTQKLSSDERSELLENVRNFTQQEPRKTADLLRKWLNDENKNRQ